MTSPGKRRLLRLTTSLMLHSWPIRFWLFSYLSPLVLAWSFRPDQKIGESGAVGL